MNKEIMKAAGFGKEVRMVEEGKCPSCSAKVEVGEFRDEISVREFKISGLCQKCQDEVFGAEEE